MTRVIGIDPGPVPGIVVLYLDAGKIRQAEALQCTWTICADVLRGLLADRALWPITIVAVERFVVGRGSQRSGRDGRVTRDLVGQLQNTAQSLSDRYVERAAAEVKPWATDDRLAHAELLEPTKGMRHARDAARHALFSAVKDCGLPDPMSKEFRR